MNSKTKQKLKGYVKVISFPLVMGIIMEVICYLSTGNHIIISKVDLNSFIKNVFILTSSGVALSLGMASGRMDFSLGSQRLIALLVGSTIALQLGLSGVGVLIFAVIFGIMAGAISGLIFVTFRIPSMVCGLGVALVFESIAFIFTDGAGVQFFGNDSLSILYSSAFVIIVCMAAIIIVTLLYSYTTFGYHYQAIRSSQKIAFNSGIKVFQNVMISYIIAGALMGLSGVFDTVYRGSMSATTGMGSVAVAFFSIVNVIIAFYYSKFISMPLAIFSVTIGMQFLNLCMTALRINSSGASAIQMIFLLLFSFGTYLINENALKKEKQIRIKESDDRWKEKNMVC